MSSLNYLFGGPYGPPPGLGGPYSIDWRSGAGGGGWVPNAPTGGSSFGLGSTYYNSSGSPIAFQAGFKTQSSPVQTQPQTQAPSQTQTPSQAQQPNQPAPQQPAQTPSPRGGTYGYGAPGAYAAPPTPPVAGAPPQAPAYSPPPQPLPSASAPAAPSLVFGQAAPQASAFTQGPTVMSMPPVNPLHAAIQSQMANNIGGASFQAPYFSDLLNKRYQGYQMT